MPDINYHGPVIAFDLDDTLFRERDFCRSGFRFLCNPQKYKIDGLSTIPDSKSLRELYEIMDLELSGRRNPFTPFEEFFMPRVLNDGAEWDLQKHIQAYRGHKPEGICLSEEIHDMLEGLSSRGYRMALVTDGRSVTQRRKIEALGIKRFIPDELIFISEETGHDKHSKEMFASIVRHFPEASGFFYIADNPEKDFYHPNLMGWTTMQVPYNSDNVHPEKDPPSEIHAPQIKLENYLSVLQLIH